MFCYVLDVDRSESRFLRVYENCSVVFFTVFVFLRRLNICVGLSFIISFLYFSSPFRFMPRLLGSDSFKSLSLYFSLCACVVLGRSEGSLLTFVRLLLPPFFSPPILQPSTRYVLVGIQWVLFCAS